MRFYQKIRFRILVCAVLLVLLVAGGLALYIQSFAKRVLLQHQFVDLFDETNLRFREVSAEIQTLREDITSLVNGPSVRRLQWAEQYRKGAIQIAPPGKEDPLVFLKYAKDKAELDFTEFLGRRPNYLRIEYFFDRTNLQDRPYYVKNRDGFAASTARPIPAASGMALRSLRSDRDVSFSHVGVWETGRGSRAVLLQASLPVVFPDSKRPPGLVVVTVDFTPWAQTLTRSPRHLVFLADENRRLLLYPRHGRPAAEVLGRDEVESPAQQEFRQQWLTDAQDLKPYTTFQPTFPVQFRYSPGPPPGRGDDNWEAPDELACLLLRCRIGNRIRQTPAEWEELLALLQRLQNEYRNLVIDAGANPAQNELLIRGWPEDRQTLDDVRDVLKKAYGSDLTFLGRPLECKHFIRTLYKFSLGPKVADSIERGQAATGPLPEQCFYIAMAAPIEAIYARIDDNNSAILLIVLVCILAAVTLSGVGAILLTRPLQVITTATQELAEGKIDVRLPTNDATEIGVLARSFASMIHQVRERQQEVARRGARLQMILDSAADAILTVGGDGAVLSCNKAAEKLFGYSAGELLGRPLAQFVEDPCLAAASTETAEERAVRQAEGQDGQSIGRRLAARLGEGKLGESIGRRKDGSAFPLEYGGNRVPLEERTLLLILRDITWRKQAEEEAQQRNQELARRVKERTAELEAANAELAQARDKAEQAAVAKDFFLATVSHELRTPLNHVTGYLQLLEMTPLDEDQQRDLTKIRHAADHLLGLVNDLLDYQKIIQGVLLLEPEEFELAAWVAELAEAMQPKIRERNNQLIVDCPADVGTLTADSKRVRQALTNLLSNAGKFTRDGVVTVSVRRERDGENDWVRLDVRDTGRGMSLEQQAKLFQPFTKLLSKSDNPEGTGLGLVLSQRLCRLMGGDLLLAHSEIGQGSTFSIILPASAATAASPPHVRQPIQAGPTGQIDKPRSVLVIDDDPEVRELMQRHLTAQGFHVHLAASGSEGLEMVKRLQPDAITLDVLMPGIDGWGTLAALQADAETAHIPVILITMLDDRTRGFALGAWEVMPKPISWSRLIDLLRHIEPSTGPVLLVDDDPVFRDLAGKTLMEHGWEVLTVENGRVALAAVARRRPALVLLDLHMPVMDGFEFLTELRKEASWRDVPVVVLSSREVTAEERRRLGGMAQRILSKGLSDQRDLLREIEWLLHHHTPASAAETAEQPMAGAQGG